MAIDVASGQGPGQKSYLTPLVQRSKELVVDKDRAIPAHAITPRTSLLKGLPCKKDIFFEALCVARACSTSRLGGRSDSRTV